MNNPLFEQAKQSVAEKHGFRDWNRVIIFGEGLPDLYYTEAADLYMRHAVNEAVKEKEEIIEKVSSRLSDLFQLLIRQSGNHPEMFSELDQMRIGAAKATIEKYAKPFDPSQVLRQSDRSLPFPPQPDER